MLNTDIQYSRTILVIEDNPATLSVLFSLLNDSGFEVMVAVDGEQAINSVTTGVFPDIILLDIILSEIDGFEVCRRLKNKEETKEIPIIFITGLTRIEDKVKGFELGAIDYITKPFEPEEVLVRIKNILTHYKPPKKTIILIKGDLLEQSITDILDFCRRQIVTGAINLSYDANRSKIVLRDGKIISCTINRIISNIDKLKKWKKGKYSVEQEITGNNSEPIIIRGIEFAPEYLQSGISILQYFGSILQQKHKDIKTKTRIEQDENKVRLVIESNDGTKEQIEKTLEEYGLVITGQMQMEEFLPDPLHIIELKNQLRMAQAQIESKKELLAYANQNIDELKFQVQQLTGLVSQAIQSHTEVVKYSSSIPIEKPITITIVTDQNVHQSQDNKQGGQFMSDSYYNQGQVGAMGRDAQAYNNVFQNVNLSSLADELSRLKAEMQNQANSSEQNISAEEVSHAESAARKGEKSKVVSHLKKAGQWALDCAKEIGTDIASEVIKKSMGL